MIVAIDGPAGAGKGTLARRLAQHYGMRYLDTGALYRATGLTVLRHKGDPGHEDDAVAAAKELTFDFRLMDETTFRAFIGNEDVTTELRREEVGNAASKVAFFPGVRQALKDFQVRFAHTWGGQSGAILDGRDIGTVICPGADVKFFLDAKPEIRAERRVAELVAAGKRAVYSEVYLEILERDARDRGRADAPLRAADDATVVDTSTLTADQVFALALTVVEPHRA